MIYKQPRIEFLRNLRPRALCQVTETAMMLHMAAKNVGCSSNNGLFEISDYYIRIGLKAYLTALVKDRLQQLLVIVWRLARKKCIYASNLGSAEWSTKHIALLKQSWSHSKISVWKPTANR